MANDIIDSMFNRKVQKADTQPDLNKKIFEATKFEPLAPIVNGPDDLFIPNYSGLKTGVQKQIEIPTTGLSGGVVFTDTNGNLSQDATNLYWDDTNNRLGIGINNPQKNLHISGSATPGVIIDSSASDSHVNFRVPGVAEWRVGIDNSDSDNFKISDSSDLGINTRMTILQSNGDIGIGIGMNNPTKNLELSGSTGIFISGGGVFGMGVSGGILAVVTSADLVGKTMVFSGGILVGYS